MKTINLKKINLSKFKIFSLLLVGIILAGFIVFQIYIDKPEYIYVRIKGSPGNWWWVTPRPPDWLSESINVGDKEYNAMNRATAEIVQKDIYDAGGTSKDVYLLAKIEAKHNARTGKYTYKGESIQIGGPISLNLNKTFFPGMITAIYGDAIPKREYQETTVIVRHLGQWPWEYDSIKVGEKIMDGDGVVIAEILDKKRRPGEKETINWQGQLVRSYSPVFEDFDITIKVKAEKNPDGLVYREDQYLKIGNNTWFLFPSYNISAAQIIDIK